MIKSLLIALVQLFFIVNVAAIFNTRRSFSNVGVTAAESDLMTKTCSSSTSSDSVSSYISTSNPNSQEAEAILRIKEYLKSDSDSEDDSVNSSHGGTGAGSESDSFLDKFHFHGWRWHTLSIIRDSSRLHNFAHRLVLQQDQQHDSSIDQRSELSKAVDHVVDFNLKGLQRIESNVFFPWLKEKLVTQDIFSAGPTSSSVSSDSESNSNKNLSDAFKQVIDVIEQEKEEVIQLANNLRSQAKKSDDKSSSVKEIAEQISQTSESMSYLIRNIFEKEVTILAPAVAKLVPAKEQIKVNNKILRNLGIFESRAILVGMFETLNDDKFGSDKERSLFEREIPYIPRKMIPRWKKNLYDVQAGMLE